MKSSYMTLSRAWSHYRPDVPLFEKYEDSENYEDFIIQHGDKIVDRDGKKVYRYDGRVYKIIAKKSDYEREKKFYESIACDGIAPTMYEADDTNQILCFADGGDILTEDNEPEDFSAQCSYINDVLSKRSIFHNDIHNRNILVSHDGNVSIVDFECATHSPVPEGETAPCNPAIISNDACKYWVFK